MSNLMTQRVDYRFGDGFPIHYAVRNRIDADSMVVLMPSALPPTRADRSLPVYARWSWSEDWPSSEVLALSDPVVHNVPAVDGAWFIHPGHDVLAALSDLARETADERGIDHDRVVFYGSSLGGFGAIGAAAHLPGSSAVAEVPQIDFENWYPGANRAVATHVLGMPVGEFRKRHPERIALKDRLEFAGLIPPMTIITNETEFSIADQHEFIRWCESSELPKRGAQRLEETTLVEGHRVLERSEIVARVRP